MPGTRRPTAFGAMTTTAALAAALGAALALPAQAPAAPRAGAVVISPAPGERIASGTARMAVRAGRERRDLRATLNGIAIGAEFRRFGRSLRRLPVSHSHGLRHGVNVLRVTARLRGTTRRATVRFRVDRRRPLAGAGRDKRAAVGVPLRLRGRLAVHPAARRRSTSARTRGRATRPRVRWTVVRAPRGSRLLRRRAAGGGRGRRRKASASQALQAPASQQLAGDSLTSGFTPDVQGRYVLRMTAGHPSGTATDTVAVDVVPRSATIPVDTAVDGPDPQGTASYGAPADASERSGIRVGDVVYRAPWLRYDGRTGFTSGTLAGGVTYASAWQVLALDRRTLALRFNRTYGLCGQDVKRICASDGAEPRMGADLAGDLRALGTGALVLVASHPPRQLSGDRGWWEFPYQLDIPGGALTAIGFPDRADPFWANLRGGRAGTVAGVGVPTMPAGAARVAFVPDGRAQLRGTLSADHTGHFGFVPSARVLFDTRATATCEPAADGRCTITQTFGDQTLSGTLDKRTSGYVVSVHDRWTLALKGSRTFPTGIADGAVHVREMADFITQQQDSLVSVTSLMTPGKTLTTDPNTPAADWKRLAEAVAWIGGTRHRFNTAASSEMYDYSVVGWTGAGEGAAQEYSNGGARLRGALVPDHRSRLTPVNVSADGAPAERLQQLIVRDPVSRWPLDDDPAASAALAWLGAQVPQLGPHPRSAYWIMGATLDTEAARSRLQDLSMPANASFDAAAFEKARRQLRQELQWVGTVRGYLDQLSQPYLTTIQAAFPASTTIADRLETELNVAREQAEMQADWFELVASLLSFAGGFEGLLGKEAAHIANFVLETSTSAMEASRFGYESNFDGSGGSAEEEIDEDRRVKADELGQELTRKAQRSADALERMGNAIVSDPVKLQEVGTYGGCNLDGGCAEGYEEYGISDADVAEAKELAGLSLERVLYGQLLTLSFPVWDTGLARDPRPFERFICAGGYTLNSPFDGNPELAATRSLEELDPSGRVTRWRTLITVARNQWVYSWPSERVLHRMFDPVNALDADAGGLAMSPQDVLRERQAVYEPGVDCGWMYDGTLPNGDRALFNEPQ